MADVIADAEPESAPNEVPAPTSESGLHELVDRLRTVRSRIAENEQTAAQDRDRILDEARQKCDAVDHWLEVLTRSDRGYAALLEQAILRFHAEQPQHGRAGRVFPGGSITQRSQPPEYRRDETAFAAWCEETGHMRSRTLAAPDWDGVKKAGHIVGNRLVMPDGECVPGVEVVERDAVTEVRLDA